MAYIPTYERKARDEGLQQGMEEGIEKGIEKGKEEGKEEANLNAAKILLANGVAINLIAKSTGLSRKKLEALAPTTH